MATTKLSSDTLLFKNGLTTNATVVATSTTTTLLGAKDINVTGGIAPTVIDTGGTITLQAGDGDTGGIGANITCEGGIATNNGDVLITASNSGAGTDGTIKLTQNGAISSWPDMTVLPTIGSLMTVSGVAGSNVTLQASSTIQDQLDVIDNTIEYVIDGRWELGETVLNWTSGINPTATTPAGVIAGNASYQSGSNYSQVLLTPNSGGQNGRIYWDLTSLGLSFVDWEIRATVLSGSGTGADGIWLIAGDSSITTSDKKSANCVSMYMNEFLNQDLVLYNGTSQVAINTNNITFDDNTVRKVSLKKVGTTITAEANVDGICFDGGTGSIVTVNGTSTGTNGTGGYFGIGAITGAATNVHVTYSFEVRVFST